MSLKTPKGEIVWVSHYSEDHELRYIITSKPLRDMYYLYEVNGNEIKIVAKDRNPLNLKRFTDRGEG